MNYLIFLFCYFFVTKNLELSLKNLLKLSNNLKSYRYFHASWIFNLKKLFSLTQKSLKQKNERQIQQGTPHFITFGFFYFLTSLIRKIKFSLNGIISHWKANSLTLSPYRRYP